MLIGALILVNVVSCKKDNFDAPNSTLSGRLIYEGQEIHIEHDQVTFELWQSGFGKNAPIKSSFSQEGIYSTTLFDGTYKFVIPTGQGPFKWKTDINGKADSLEINLKGNQTIDIEVIPYYLIKNAELSSNNSAILANFQIEKIISGAESKDIEHVSLYINKTQFVSGNSNSNVGKGTLNGNDIADLSNIQLSVDIPTMIPKQNYIFARIGIKIQGVEDLIYSPLKKLDLN